MTCPSEDDLLAFARGLADPAARTALASHVGDCHDCRRLVAEAARELSESTMAAGSPRPDALPPPLGPGARLGRYVILDLIGQGAMGVVYGAYDPDLDRRIALKVLRPDRLGDDQGELRQRLLREGQSMARLSHPNVVAVHDVGVLDDAVFLAMEHVEGETLRAWLEREPRPWRAVLAAFVEAGRGLAAAHRAGLVHRDFKPDNVLVGRDGRVRVTDFGLARVGEEERDRPAGTPAHPLLSLTHSGTVVGTPAFMAPEQLRGEPAGVPADVFAFCSALYQCLYGKRPFPGDNYEELRGAVLAGKLRPLPASAVPARVGRAVLAGLALDPAARPASMDDLLGRLAVSPGRRASRIVALLAVAAAAAGAAWRLRAAPHADPCRGGAARLAAVWNPGRADELRRAFAATGATYADRSASLVVRLLDAQGGRWVAGYTDACEATSVRHEQSEQLLDRRMACLDGRLREVDALVMTLARADGPMLVRGPLAVAALSPAETCADGRQLMGAVPEPADPLARARIDGARGTLARAQALRNAGRYQEALADAEGALGEGRAIGHAPLEAEALFEVGLAQRELGKPVESEATLALAVQAAARGGLDEVGARAKTELVYALGLNHKIDEALRWGAVAEGEIARWGNDPLMRAALLAARGRALTKDDRPEAVPQLEEAEGLLEKQLGRDHPRVAQAMDWLGIALYRMSRYADALSWHERAARVYEDILGPDHPETARAEFNQATDLKALGRRNEALALDERVLAVREKALGTDNYQVAITLGNLGEVLGTLGRYGEAVSALERALAIGEKRLGPDHPELISFLGMLSPARAYVGRADDAAAAGRRALALTEAKMGPDSAMAAFVADALANALERSGRFAEACPVFERAITTLSRAAPEHSDLADMLRGRGRCLERQGKLAEAQATLERAVSISEKAFGPDHPDVANERVDLAATLLARGQAPAARDALERAVRVLEKVEGDPLDLARARLGLALALRASGGPAERAESLAAAGTSVILASPYASAELRRRAQAWRPGGAPR